MQSQLLLIIGKHADVNDHKIPRQPNMLSAELEPAGTGITLIYKQYDADNMQRYAPLLNELYACALWKVSKPSNSILEYAKASVLSR